MKIYIDDLRTPKEHSWVICRSYDEFEKLITEYEEPTQSEIFISFDHDLGMENGGEAKSGHDCAKLLVERNNLLLGYSVHSSNSVGRDNIIGLLNHWHRFNESDVRGNTNITDFTV